MREQEWPDGLTPDVLEELVAECIHRHDFDGVEKVLRVLAVRAPHRAEAAMAAIEFGIALKSAPPVGVGASSRVEPPSGTETTANTVVVASATPDGSPTEQSPSNGVAAPLGDC